MDAAVTGSKKAITFVVMMAALMALIDITIVNVALNDIQPVLTRAGCNARASSAL